LPDNIPIDVGWGAKISVSLHEVTGTEIPIFKLKESRHKKVYLFGGNRVD
jgi:hypothetical protein